MSAYVTSALLISKDKRKDICAMPYVIEPGAVLEIRLRASLFGQVVINTFHYSNEAEYSDGGAALLLAMADFNAVVWSAITNGISDKVLNVKIDGQWVYPIRYRTQTIDATPGAGSHVGSTTQTGTAAVIKRFGEAANRHNQGRIYVYGVPTSFQGDGVWTNAFITTEGQDMADAVKAVIQTGLTEQLRPILWDRLAPTALQPIVGSGVNPVIRYQRRREVGVGQ